MILTIIIILVLLVVAFGMVALYREVGFGRFSDDHSTATPTPSASQAQSRSQWPLGTLTSGSHFAIPSDDAFTGFLAICSDDADALGALYSVAVVAADWDYPLLIAIGKTSQSSGWTDRLDGLPGTIGEYEISIDEVRVLRPSQLPVVMFLNGNRVLGATVALDSPSSVATSFQHCRFGLKR